MSEQETLWAEYNGTAGYVPRASSMQRAAQEIADGSLSKRQQDILELLRHCEGGLTWKELGDRLDLHHGKVSGALSNMHKAGVVFMLRVQRNKCHPYVHAMFRDLYTEEQRHDAPVRTRTSQRLEQLEMLLEACRIAEDNAWSLDMQDLVNTLVDSLSKHEH